MDHNDVLKDLHAQIQESSLVRSADDIQIGDIIYVEMDRNDGIVLVDGYDTRLKYIVVAGSKSDKKEFAVVLINSEADFSDDPDWQGEQYLLRHSDYAGVLEHDSWIDCTDPKILSLRKMKAKKASKKGYLVERDLVNVTQKLKNSEFIDERTKKVYHLV